jgi:cbb3-type cytochrome oxidase subunit 3
MFDQFVKDVSGEQMYLIFSLWIFLVFFIVVSFLLYITKKQHVDRMSDLPLEDGTVDSNQPLIS